MANVIFDFDGTLADTLHIAIDVFRRISPEDDIEDDKKIEELRGMSAFEAIKHLGISWWRVPRLLIVGRKEMTAHIGEANTFPGMVEVIHKLKAAKHRLFILSSNSTRNIAIFLKNHRLESYFDHYWGDQGIFTKSSALKKVMRKEKLDAKDCYYIGDEVRDIEAARKAGIRPISVTWGYNNRKALETAKPDILIDQPADLLDVIG